MNTAQCRKVMLDATSHAKSMLAERLTSFPEVMREMAEKLAWEKMANVLMLNFCLEPYRSAAGNGLVAISAFENDELKPDEALSLLTELLVGSSFQLAPQQKAGVLN